jgi:hypothetical protein
MTGLVVANLIGSKERDCEQDLADGMAAGSASDI